MAILRRRRSLDLRPAAESHEKFICEHPDAHQLPADADEHPAERKAECQRELAVQAARDAELID